MNGSFSLAELARELGIDAPRVDASFSRVSTDTRTLQAGDLYIALKGERFDGNAFVAEAARRGAAAVIAQDLPEGFELPSLLIADSHLTLLRLARMNRRRCAAVLVALTGSQGKTSVKEMLGSIFKQQAATHVTSANFNNTIGVPLTLLDLERQHEFAVIEMGANGAGEIALSVGCAEPNIALITKASAASGTPSISYNTRPGCVLGEHMAPGMEIEIALRNYDIPHDWPDAVAKFAKKLPPEVKESDKLERVDLRNVPLVTIDGESSRDFDDAVYCETKKSGGWRLYVAIADVSHYVKYNSPMDKEAIERGNSVYFPDQVVPMLPEELSNGLCSLNPQVDRLCLVCEMTIAESGKLSGYKFYEAVMHSHARLTYTKVAAMLDGDADLIDRYQEIYPHILNLYELFKTLKHVRAERGAFEFETIEPKFVFNAQRKIDSVETVIRNDAHKIIEECMILANVATAKMLEKHNAGALFRVHDKPDPSKLANFRAFLSELGGELTFSNEPSPKELSEQINKYLSRPDGELIQTMMIRSMRQAVYQADNIGHFGLALEGYAHFTSPIRRYPDLIVHRAIKAIIKAQGQKTSGEHACDDEELEFLGEQCSMTERRADEATRDVESALKCEFMQDHISNEYMGVISSVTSFGMFVRLNDLHIEGLVHITALGNDYFHYDNERHLLIGERTRRVYRLGDEVEVKVRSVDMEEKQIDFELAGIVSSARVKGSAKGGRTRFPTAKEGKSAMSVREQLRRGHVPGSQKQAEEKKRGDKSQDDTKKYKNKRSDNNEGSETSNKKGKGKSTTKKGRAKPKSRAAKRVAARKATKPKKSRKR